MDGRLRSRVSQMARTLALEEKERLEAAGTLVDLEQLTMEIGDELTRQLSREVLAARSDTAFKQQSACCPTCGKDCQIEPDPEPVVLQGMRGEIDYVEPRYHCSRCRRDFFPSGGNSAASNP